MPAIQGLNHLTLSITDLERSFAFYVDLLGCRPVARWSRGAYLETDDLWLALVVDTRIGETRRPDYSHIAFSCAPDDFPALQTALQQAGAAAWSENESEGDSYYFCDPDGHKLEIHVGDLASRLAHMKAHPWDAITFY